MEALTVVNWAFHEDVGTGWKFTPSPNPEGIIFLDAGYHWISWRGKSLDRLTFDLGLSGNKLEKIEFTCEFLCSVCVCVCKGEAGHMTCHVTGCNIYSSD